MELQAQGTGSIATCIPKEKATKQKNEILRIHIPIKSAFMPTGRGAGRSIVESYTTGHRLTSTAYHGTANGRWSYSHLQIRNGSAMLSMVAGFLSIFPIRARKNFHLSCTPE